MPFSASDFGFYTPEDYRSLSPDLLKDMRAYFGRIPYKDWRAWADNKVDPEVLTYLDENPELLYGGDEVEGRTSATPAGWIRLSKVLKVAQAHDRKTREAIFASFIGETAAFDFCEWLER